MQEALTADEASKMTLKELRQQSGKTAAEVAAALGVTEQAIRHYENGLRSIGLRQVLVLAELYDVSEREIIEAQMFSITVCKPK